MYIMTPFLTIRRLLLCNIVRYTFPYKAVSQFITIHKQNRYRRNYFEMVLLLKIYVRAKGSSILVLPLESLPTFEKNDPKKVFLPNKLQGYIICIFKKKTVYFIFPRHHDNTIQNNPTTRLHSDINIPGLHHYPRYVLCSAPRPFRLTKGPCAPSITRRYMFLCV